MSEERIERREFLKRVGSTGLALAGVTAGALLLHDTRSAKEYFRDARGARTKTLPSYQVELGPTDVQMAIVHGQEVERMVRAALDALGGMGKFVQKGEVVVLKPNVAFDRPPALGATTSPEVLRAVARLCFEAGARQVIVADNPINQPEGCFFKTGIKRAAEEVGATVMLPQPSAFEPLAINGEVLDVWPMFYRPFARATKVIGIATCKDHNLCSASLTMKNWYGLLGGRRNQFHQQIHGVISDFPHMIKPTLVILDAMRILMTNGPTGGRLSDVKPGNTIICGVDMVAVDAYGYTLLGRDPEQLDYLQRAHQRGLGNKNWQELNWRELQV